MELTGDLAGGSGRPHVPVGHGQQRLGQPRPLLQEHGDAEFGHGGGVRSKREGEVVLRCAVLSARSKFPRWGFARGCVRPARSSELWRMSQFQVT